MFLDESNSNTLSQQVDGLLLIASGSFPPFAVRVFEVRSSKNTVVTVDDGIVDRIDGQSCCASTDRFTTDRDRSRIEVMKRNTVDDDGPLLSLIIS